MYASSSITLSLLYNLRFIFSTLKLDLPCIFINNFIPIVVDYPKIRIYINKSNRHAYIDLFLFYFDQKNKSIYACRLDD